jgi:hypothetical protein
MDRKDINAILHKAYKQGFIDAIEYTAYTRKNDKYKKYVAGSEDWEFFEAIESVEEWSGFNVPQI